MKCADVETRMELSELIKILIEKDIISNDDLNRLIRVHKGKIKG